jgi:hypothetical protein
MLGNLSILNNEYVCTVPLELNQGLNELMSVAEKVMMPHYSVWVHLCKATQQTERMGSC